MRVFQYIIKICAIYSFTLLKFTIGNHPLEGLHKAAAQNDRARIMHIMRVSIINIIIMYYLQCCQILGFCPNIRIFEHENCLISICK